MHFESLGQNCEFGLLQRHFLAEPLGLLRWATTRPPSLLRALQARFEGTGSPEQMRLLSRNGEYGLFDLAYKIDIHTAIRTHEAEADLIHAKQCRRTGFLKDKLLKQLADHKRIFVYFDTEQTDQSMMAIHAALSDFGPNRLLWVRVKDAAHPAGSIDVLNETLIVGYIGRQGLQNGVWNICTGSWLDVCEAVYRAWAPAHGTPQR
jgi:hypothetical protein